MQRKIQLKLGEIMKFHRENDFFSLRELEQKSRMRKKARERIIKEGSDWRKGWLTHRHQEPWKRLSHLIIKGKYCYCKRRK